MNDCAIITVAGTSSRFNEGVVESERVLKCLFGEPQNTLLWHLLNKVRFFDKIIIVGGYKFEDLEKYCSIFLKNAFHNIELVKNDYFEKYSSGYSLYLGINAALKYNPSEIVLVEGDLDVDDESFKKVVMSERSTVTFSNEPIYSNKSVVLYKNNLGQYKYIFNSEHGMLFIPEPFSCVMNSAQIWKFMDMVALKNANEKFISTNVSGTNLTIIQAYFDAVPNEDIVSIPMAKWINCNTRNDYNKALERWREE